MSTSSAGATYADNLIQKGQERRVNANNIINDEMTLDEKLAAIDAAMKTEAVEFNKKNGRALDAPVDPADLTTCDSCQ